MFKAVWTVKENVEVEFLGRLDVVPIYRYVCYVRSYNKDVTDLHEIYKQRSVSEIWIEQVKGYAITGGTLINNFGQTKSFGNW